MVLAEMKQIDRLILCTIERGQQPVNYTGPRNEKISFYPLYSKSIKLGALNKIVDFILFPAILKNLARMHDIDFILSRGTPAGSLAWKVFRKTGIPFGVESFEPHAEYMLESDVWKKSGLKYHTQKKWEVKQKQAAQFLITVSHNYREQLLAEGLPEEKVYTIPCTVDTDTFAFDSRQRAVIRERLQIPEGSIVGVYVGKFGDIYYDEEAFYLIRQAFDFFGPPFFMFIITPQNKTTISLKISKFGLDINRFFIDSVSHSEVPHYLSAADFAFSFVRPAESRKFCSPIKHGEYWANGLPIIMGEGIGDDSDIINNNPICGVLMILN
jgi:glycosyltransferase involved in cell wall biosynthesis